MTLNQQSEVGFSARKGEHNFSRVSFFRGPIFKVARFYLRISDQLVADRQHRQHLLGGLRDSCGGKPYVGHIVSAIGFANGSVIINM